MQSKTTTTAATTRDHPIMTSEHMPFGASNYNNNDGTQRRRHDDDNDDEQQRQRRTAASSKTGNLQTLLSNFDVVRGGDVGGGGGGGTTVATVSSDVSLNIDGSGGGQGGGGGGEGRDRSSTLGSELGFGGCFRDRSATFGSDFDLAPFFGFGTTANSTSDGVDHGISIVPDSAAATTATTMTAGAEAGERLGGGRGRVRPMVPLPAAPQVPHQHPMSVMPNASPTASSSSAATIMPFQSRPSPPAAAAVAARLEHHDHSPSATSSASSSHHFADTKSSKIVPSIGNRLNSGSTTTSRPVPVHPTTHRHGSTGSGPPSQASSHGSTASAFLSGILSGHGSSGGATGGGHGTQQQQQHNIMIAHTPPSAMGTSYEARHFGKRMRAGSISGRLRSASDLEDKGIIDRSQKEIIKDLIISGDDALQSALDMYEEGDPSHLENMIKSGALLKHNAEDIDLLGDLDLDFLNVNDDFGDSTDATTATAAPLVPMGSDYLGIPPPTMPYTRSKSMPIPMQPSPGLPTQQQGLQLTAHGGSRGISPQIVTSNMERPTAYADDGIGDLDFNGDFGGGDDYMTDTSYNAPMGSVSTLGQIQRVRSDSLAYGLLLDEPSLSNHGQNSGGKNQHQVPGLSIEDQRLRSNSLAFGTLLNEPPSSSGAQHSSLDQWLDQPSSNKPQVGNAPSPLDSVPSIVVGANGGLYIVGNNNNSNNANNASIYQTLPMHGSLHQGMQTPSLQTGGIGAALERDATARNSQGALAKMELAEERRREKQEKKEQKERERLEKKEKREREMRERKEREALEKQERRQKKTAAAKAKQEEKRSKKSSPKSDMVDRVMRGSDEDDDDEEEEKETPSGLGRPRSMSDPNLRVSMDEHGLLQVDRPEGWIGAYSPESRKIRIDRFLAKRHHRVWTKKVKYDVRKNFADSRLRVKGRFVKKEDELLMRDLMSLT